MAGDIVPGPTGAQAVAVPIDEGTLARVANPTPAVLGTGVPPLVPPLVIDADTKMLAATAYGEGSSQNVFEEMAAIANVLVRQQKARGYASISAFITADKTFAFAAHDGNQRYAKLMAAKPADIEKDAGMAAAVKGAQNALAAGGTDYSNGAYFWDGADIKSNYANHAKVLGGVHITDPKHNIYKIDDKDVPGETWWLDAKGKKTKLRGKWDYKYESTAGWGGTIFWKYNAAFVKASGNKEHK